MAEKKRTMKCQGDLEALRLEKASLKREVGLLSVEYLSFNEDKKSRQSLWDTLVKEQRSAVPVLR